MIGDLDCELEIMPPQLRRVRLSLPKPFKTRWSTRSGRKSPALVSPASLRGSSEPTRSENAEPERNFTRIGNDALGDIADDRVDMEIETINPVGSLESSLSWNNHGERVDSNLPAVATIENDFETDIEEEETMAEETFYSTATSIATTAMTEGETTEDMESDNAAIEIISDLDDASDYITSTEEPDLVVQFPTTQSRNSVSNHDFKIGDRVRVIKKGEKYGMCGVVHFKKVFVKFRDERTNEEVQIKPKFLELLVGDATSRDERKPVNEQQQSPLQQISSPTFETDQQLTELATKKNNHQQEGQNNPSLSSQKPKDFPIGSTVLVHSSNPKHAGKVGRVRDHTQCYVRISFTANDKKGFLVKPKFLVHITDDNQSISTSKSSETTSFHPKDEYDAPREDVEESTEENDGIAAFNFKKFAVKRICLGLKTPSTCAFEAIWSRENYLPPIEMPLSDLPLKRRVGNKEYDLYFADVGEDTSGFSRFKKKKVTAYYVYSDNLREHEELLADFGSLPPHKVWARRKLLFSPATKLGDKYAIKAINANDLTMVDDLGTAGCGFISEPYLENLLGNNKAAKNALGVQVRIFVPTKGIFKGVLIRKRNLQEPIQLNDSLQKVGPSRKSNASDTGWIVITRTFPSTGNHTFSRVFKNKEEHQKLKPLPKLVSFGRELQKEQSFKISPMYQTVMESLGVSASTLQQYINDYKKNPEKIQHTHLVGMADPTNQLPPNTVFITGIKGFEIDEIFVTRSPCMERKDGRVVRVVATKPGRMNIDYWDWLQNLSFGAMIYANPAPGDRPLPELIADGDLDGDLYFVCWNRILLTQMNPIPFHNDELVAELETEAKSKKYDPEWFDRTQRFLAKAPTLHAGIDELVGRFHNLWKEINDITDANAISFSSASKQALDLKTHGGLISLPRNLWDKVPNRLHRYLTAD